MSGTSIGECWEAICRWSLYNYAIENVLHFETIPGSMDGAAIAAELKGNLLDQWAQKVHSQQQLRAIYVRRLDIIHPVYTASYAFPYLHGGDGGDDSLSELAATLNFKSGSHYRTDWSRKYYGALTAAAVDQGRLSTFHKNWLDGFGVYLMTNYGYPQIDKPTLITWSRKIWAATVDRDQAATRVTSIFASERLAVIHSRRIGKGY